MCGILTRGTPQVGRRWNADSRSLRVTTTPANAPGTIYFLLLVTGCGRYMVYLVGRLSERPVILEFVCQKGLRLSDVGDV